MDHENYSDAYLREILTSARTIAIVGASPRRERPSHRVMAYLQRHGYRTIPVNPNAAGETILGETCYATLADIPEPIDMVDIFRRSELAGAAVDAAIAIGAKAVWMQLDVRDDAAAARAEAAGLKVVMNRCPAIEIPRLGLPPSPPHLEKASVAPSRLWSAQRRFRPFAMAGLTRKIDRPNSSHHRASGPPRRDHSRLMDNQRLGRPLKGDLALAVTRGRRP